MLSGMEEPDRMKVGAAVRRRRVDLGWSKEAGAREAGISSITWKRVEDGLPVQDAKLAQILRALGLHALPITDGTLIGAEGGLQRRTGRGPLAPDATTSLERQVADAYQHVVGLRAQLHQAEARLDALSLQLARSNHPYPSDESVEPAAAARAREILAEGAGAAAAPPPVGETPTDDEGRLSS